MPWILQPHNYNQLMRPNLYRVDYRRNAMYKGMGRLGQACADPTNPACVNPAGTDIYQISADGQLLPATQYVGSYTPTTTPTTPTWLIWALGGVVVLALMAGRR